MTSPFLAALLASSLGFAGLLSAQVQWTQEKPSPLPSSRSNHAMVWMGDRAILFGGENGGFLDDTWEWKNNKWKQLSPATKPSRRGGHCMAYDPARKVVVMFSGWNGGSYVPDLWEFDGTTWKNKTTGVLPPPRDWAQMAYDPIQKAVVLFGGHDWRRHSNNGPGAWDDMWAWNGQAWKKLTPRVMAPKRFGHTMVQVGATILMIGGVTPGKTYNDMWRWLGSTWVQVKPKTLPGARNWAAAAVDTARGRLVVHGGTAGGQLSDTWEWTGRDWVQRASSSGPTVSWGAAVFDNVRNRTFVVGGALKANRKTPTPANWSYGPVKPAAYSKFGTSCPGSNGTPTLESTHAWLGQSTTISLDKLQNNAAALCFFGSNNTQWGAFKLPLSLAFLGAKNCSLRVDPLLNFFMSNSSGTASLTVRRPQRPQTRRPQALHPRPRHRHGSQRQDHHEQRRHRDLRRAVANRTARAFARASSHTSPQGRPARSQIRPQGRLPRSQIRPQGHIYQKPLRGF